MIRSLVALLVLLPLGLAQNGLAASAAPPPSHDPILIDGPEDVATPDAVSGNGIRSGRGTPADPYVISDWTIKETSGVTSLVTIQNVAASFRIERVVLSASRNQTYLVAAESIIGLALASNTFNNGALSFSSIPSVMLQANLYGAASFYAERVSSLSLSKELGIVAGMGVSAFHNGKVHIADSRLQFLGGFQCTGCKEAVFEKSHFSGKGTTGFLMQIIGGYGDGVRFEDVQLDTKQGGIEITFQRNTIFNHVSINGSPPYNGVKVGENFTFDDLTVRGVRTGVEVTRLDRGTIRESTFENISAEAIQFWENVGEFTVERTEFSGVGCGLAAPAMPEPDGRPPAYRANDHNIRNLHVHNSSFSEARNCGVFLNIKGSNGDARWNWWGGLGSPPVGWCFPKPGLVSPGIQVEPTLEESPHGLSAAEQERQECSRFPIPFPGVGLLLAASIAAGVWVRRRDG